MPAQLVCVGLGQFCSQMTAQSSVHPPVYAERHWIDWVMLGYAKIGSTSGHCAYTCVVNQRWGRVSNDRLG